MIPGLGARQFSARQRASTGNEKRSERCCRGLPRSHHPDCITTVVPEPGRLMPSGLSLGSEQPFALRLLARELARPANRLGPLTSAALGRLLVMLPKLHFAKNALALHLLLQRAERLIDIVVTDSYLHSVSPPFPCRGCMGLERYTFGLAYCPVDASTEARDLQWPDGRGRGERDGRNRPQG